MITEKTMTPPRHWTRRTFLTTASAATLATTKLHAAPTAPVAEKLVYIGSGANGPTAGIHVATWNPSNGTLANLHLAMQADGAAFLATTELSGKRILFAGHQLPAKMGALSGYQIGPTGDLQLINTTNVREFDFVHTAVDHTGQALITASYGSGKVLSVKIAPNGQLSAPVSQFQLTGHGPNASRQLAPHAHGVAIAPDNRFVLINDLGTDRIMIYKLNAATAELTPNNPPYFETAPGSGPRHTAFHPSGKWAYSINELDSTITQMGWNAATGTLTLASNTPTMPPGSDVTAGRAGEVVFDKTGRFLYACNRAAIDDIVVYSVGNSGGLTLVQHLNFGGKEARHYAISPDGTHFILAEQFSDKVAILNRNPTTGTLKLSANEYAVQNPSCILFT
jgi:6-phosphogluconolactonase